MPDPNIQMNDMNERSAIMFTRLEGVIIICHYLPYYNPIFASAKVANLRLAHDNFVLINQFCW